MTEPDQSKLDSHSCTIVEEILSRAWDCDVRLGEVKVLREDKCYRVGLVASGAGTPESAIVKKARANEESVADPDSAEPNPAHRLLDEWAGLALLTELSSSGGLVPILYGGNRDACLVVYEDWGVPRTLGDVLTRDDPDAAVSGLCAHARAVAELHNASMGFEERHQAIRDALGPRVEDREGLGWRSLATRRSLVRDFLSSMDVNPRTQFWDEYDAASCAISRHGPCRAFVHNDSCPDNTAFLGDRLRLFDLERGGFHHRFLDAVYARMSMPHCYLANVTPGEAIREAERAYQDESRLQGDLRFGEEIVNGCFYWTVGSGAWQAEMCMESDFDWGLSTGRQRVIHRLGALADACEEFDHVPVIGETARRLAERLQGIWLCEPMPLFPAFR